MIYPIGSASQTIDVMFVDDSGLPLTGKVAADFPTLTYSLAGPNADVAFPALSNLALITTAWAAGGVKERGNGVYRLDLPNGVFAAGGEVTIRGEASGKHIISPKISVGLAAPPETAGRPGSTDLLGMLRRVFEWRGNKRTRDRASGLVSVRNSADSGNLETATQSTSGSVDTFGQGG